MKKTELLETIISRLWDVLDDEDILSMEYVQPVKNNNVVMDAINVILKDCPIAPCVYIGHRLPYFQRKRKGEVYFRDEDIDINCLVDVIEMDIRRAIEDTNESREDFDASNFCTERIIPVMVNYKNNKDFLINVPHKRFMDLAIVLRVMWDINGMTGSAIINNSNMELFDESFDILFQKAMENYFLLLTPQLKSMTDLLIDADYSFLDDSMREDFPFMVLTNHRGYYASAAMICTEYLSTLREELGEDFYIIPSSVHELIIVPKRYVDDRNELQETIQIVNKESVPEEEVLSDSLYYFDGELKFSIKA